MHSRTALVFETFRKPLSRLAVAAILALALFVVPRNFNNKAGETLELLGFVFLIVAALGRVWCSIYISGRKDRVLCTEGPYSVSRNPLYFFSFVGVMGFSFALQSLSILLFSSGLFLLYYYFVIRSEESRLAILFGSSFHEYCSQTPRFFPSRLPASAVTSYTINPKVIERGLREVIWFLLAIVAIELLEMLHSQGHLVFAIIPF